MLSWDNKTDNTKAKWSREYDYEVNRIHSQ